MDVLLADTQIGGMADVDQPISAQTSIQNRESDCATTHTGLHQNEQWLRMLIDSAEDYAIFAVTPDRKICTWNKGAEHLFGYSEPEILGKDFSIIFTSEDRAI